MFHGFLLRLVLGAGGLALILGIAGLLLLALAGHDPTTGRRRSQIIRVLGAVFLVMVGSTLLALGLTTPLVGLFLDVKTALTELDHTKRLALASYQLQSEAAIRAILSDAKHRDPKKLNSYEYKVFSQNGEDGITAEIFRRIGTTNRYFVEFGAADGFENNTVLLLRQGWSGLWMEGDPALVARATAHFRPEIDAGRLTVTRAFITAENINALFEQAKVPEEPDLVSIDIDGNDYYVWDKLTRSRPRVVIIEYNPIYPPTMSWVIPYDPQGMWDGRTTRMGASLKALEELGSKKGYKLVGCSLAGVNAFFVRSDLLGDHFASPYTAENHYEPMRYNLNKYDTSLDRVP